MVTAPETGPASVPLSFVPPSLGGGEPASGGGASGAVVVGAGVVLVALAVGAALAVPAGFVAPASALSSLFFAEQPTAARMKSPWTIAPVVTLTNLMSLEPSAPLGAKRAPAPSP